MSMEMFLCTVYSNAKCYTRRSGCSLDSVTVIITKHLLDQYFVKHCSLSTPDWLNKELTSL